MTRFAVLCFEAIQGVELVKGSDTVRVGLMQGEML